MDWLKWLILLTIAGVLIRGFDRSERAGYDVRAWAPQIIACSLPGISPAVPALCQTKWVSQRTKSFQATDGIYSNPLLQCPTKVGRDWQPLSWHKIHSNFSMAEYVRPELIT